MCDWGRRKQALGGGEDRKSLISQKLGVENLNFFLGLQTCSNQNIVVVDA